MAGIQNENFSLDMLDEMMAYIESQASMLDSATFTDPSLSVMTSMLSTQSGFTSLIKFSGQPILPPVMTEHKRNEMQAYKRQALIAETRMKNRRLARRKQLVDKVQAIVDGIEARKSVADTSATSSESRTDSDVTDSNDLVDSESDLHQSEHGSIEANTQSLPKTVAAKQDEIPNIVPVSNPGQQPVQTMTEFLKSNVGMQPLVNTTEPGPITVVGSITSSTSSSASELNQTVIEKQNISSQNNTPNQNNNKDAGSPHESSYETVETLADSPVSIESKDTEKETKEQDRNVGQLSGLLSRVVLSPDTGPDTPSDNSHTYPPVTAMDNSAPGNQTADNAILNSGKEDDNSPRSLSMFDSDAMSYIGEYNSLPTPGPTKTPEVSTIMYIDPENLTNENVSSGPLNMLPPSASDQFIKTDTSSQLILGTASTDLRPYMQGSLDTMSSSLTLKDEEVVAIDKVHEANVPKSPNSKSSTVANTPASKDRIRRDSYTLDHPSPALLNAQKSVQRKLDYTSVDSNSKTTAKNQTNPAQPSKPKLTPRDSLDSLKTVQRERHDSESAGKREHLQKYLDQISAQPPSFPARRSQSPRVIQDHNQQAMHPPPSTGAATQEEYNEHILQQQAQQFELLRQKLVEQQKQQLASLLYQQEQEQLQLKRELQEQERQFNESRQSLLAEQSRQKERQEQKQWLLQVQQQQELENYQMNSTALPMSSLNVPGHPSQPSRVSPISASSPMVQNPGPQQHRHSGQKVQRSPRGVGQTSPYLTGSPASQYSVRSGRLVARTAPYNYVKTPQKAMAPEMHSKYCKISAAVKGYLTRRLLHSEKVQEIIKTIRDTTDFAISFQSETPIKKGMYSHQDKTLQDRVIAQLQAALLEIHDIFFDTPVPDQMQLIAVTRQLEQERRVKEKDQKNEKNKKRLSVATLKAMERKKQAKAAEAAVFGALRPRTAPPDTSSPKKAKPGDMSAPIRRQYQFIFNRALHGHVSPIKPVQDKENKVVSKQVIRPKTAPPEKTDVTNASKIKKSGVPAQKTVRRNLYGTGSSTARSKKAAVSPRVRPKSSRGAWK